LLSALLLEDINACRYTIMMQNNTGKALYK